MFEDNIVVLKEFNRLINSTENVYLDILSEALPFIVSNFPGGEMALKVCKSLSKLQNSSIKAFLLETGNQDIRTAIKIITNDLDGKNFDYELIQALTLLKRGRDTFLNLIDKEYKTWFADKLRKQLGIDRSQRVNNYDADEFASDIVFPALIAKYLKRAEAESDAYPAHIVACRTVCYKNLNACLAGRESKCIPSRNVNWSAVKTCMEDSTTNCGTTHNSCLNACHRD